MNTDIRSFITHTANGDWQPLIEKGRLFRGVYVQSLRQDMLAQRSPSILLKFEAGSAYPYHEHPAGEEIFVLDGECVIENTLLRAGDYLYTPPGYRHAVRSDTGCTLLLIIPEEVVILQ